MAKILLDYVFPITLITPTPAASTAYLKQVAIVCKPKAGQEANVGQAFLCVSMTEVGVRTNNTNAQQLFNAGMSRCYVILSDDLQLSDVLTATLNQFWTLLISDDFDDDDLMTEYTVEEVKSFKKVQDILYTSKLTGTDGDDITITYTDTNTGGAASVSVSTHAITVSIEAGVTTAAAIAAAIAAHAPSNALVGCTVDTGDESDPQDAITAQTLTGGVDPVTVDGTGLDKGPFKGVVGASTQDPAVAADFAAVENQCCFLTSGTNKAKNMVFAFGSMLSNPTNWSNQQYITMPFDDDIDELGEANSLFDDRISFVIHDDEFSNRLGFFAAGGKAIVAPYILKNLMVDLQSKALQWISANQPSYTLKNAALLETRLVEDVINQKYITLGWIEEGTVEILLIEDNFVASGFINVTEPKALWRVFSQMQATL